MKYAARASLIFDRPPVVVSCAAVAGSKEGQGPLGTEFDRVYSDNLLGEDTWEKAESRLVTDAVNICLEKAQLPPESVDVIFTGDLLNQCIASTFGLRALGVPHVGMYGACSTMASTLINAAVFAESGAAKRAVAVTSSHFSSSERQFRTPLQYGGQRTPTAQWTVTASGAAAVSSADEAQPDSPVRICAATVGTIEDLGITDPNNMGAAMAPVDVKLTP